jgi:hypothetical protein
MSPIAKGIFVLPIEKELMKLGVDGIKYPIDIPMNIAKNIQRVKYLSINPNFFLWLGHAFAVSII